MAYSLTIPVDVSKLEEFESGYPIKVGAELGDGSIISQTIKMPASGKGTAKFDFDERPGNVRVAVGPGDASDEELMGLQTINLNVSPRQWTERTELKVEPVIVTQHYWLFWRRWCRTFVVRGKIICPDGSPVPGAEVCAFDVDWWWWWCSRQKVGCATTDQTGTFVIKFRHCCGWWPWWWWARRHWHLEPRLSSELMPVLRSQLKLRKLPRLSPLPDLDIFDEILQSDLGRLGSDTRFLPEATAETKLQRPKIDLDRLEKLRLNLVERIPVVPKLERLRLWPWWPWTPWADCAPDLIFHATQNCGGEAQVIVDETCWDTRWNVGTETDVTLVAPEACCIEPCPDCPEGNCVVISRVCGIVVDSIGGNPGALPAPAGYAHPGTQDRPFAGSAPIAGEFGAAAAADYYEFEISSDDGATFDPLPAAAAGGFNRVYWGPKVGTNDPPEFHYQSFQFNDISGRRVIESRAHFESQNDPTSWNVTRFWAANTDLLMIFYTENILADGRFHLRIKSYAASGGSLGQAEVLPLCNTQDDNGLVLTLDNRVVGDGSAHPASTPAHPVGGVHRATLEPDTDILSVRIDGQPVEPCTIVDASTATQLQIDFMAHDIDNHLWWYTLVATYGENQVAYPLSQASSTLVPLSAAYVGPTYADVLVQAGGSSPSPVWAGGTFRLTVDVADVFKESCAYQLELRARKRNIYNCSNVMENYSHYSFTVIV